MRIAVIGGNLLGCATVADLALVQEIDARKGRCSEKHELTLFAQEPALGGSDFRTVDVDGVAVEVGRYRTLSLIAGTYLKDLVDLARGAVGHVQFGPRRVKIPGDARLARGSPSAFSVAETWAAGTYRRLIRSFGVWDWDADRYHQIHKGWSVLDILHCVLSNEMWRAAAVAAFLWSVRRCMTFETHLERGQALVLVVVLFAFVLLSPAGVVAIWQRTYSFWGSTLPALLEHGLTAGISRGSTLGFVRQLAENNQRNRATCAPSLAALLSRTGLKPYVHGSGGDYVAKFKFDPTYVSRYMAPPVSIAYPGAGLADVNSLACHLAQFAADFSNSDIAARRSALQPANKALCDALVEAARPSTDVDVRLNTAVRHIAFDEDAMKYTLTTAAGDSMQFDGIVLCECPDPDALVALSPRGSPLAELLSYERGADARPGGPASHLAVVVGVAEPAFFRFSAEKHIPDLVQVCGSPIFSSVERVREVGPTGEHGIYVVHCSGEFETSGAFKEMFESGATIAYFEPRPSVPYSAGAIGGEGSNIDEFAPPVVLGTRFVYAAASYRLAVHPEMDAMSALNAASLFSKAVNWASPQADEEEDEEDEEEDGAEEAGDSKNAEAAAGVEDTDFPDDNN